MRPASVPSTTTGTASAAAKVAHDAWTIFVIVAIFRFEWRSPTRKYSTTTRSGQSGS